MKRIELKIFDKRTETDEEKNIFQDYKQILSIALKAVPRESSPNLEEMGDRLNILKKIKDTPSGANLDLENAEFRTLAKCCSQAIWAVIDEDLFECLSEVKKINEGPELTEEKKAASVK